ncbi:MAG: hypothetical protein JWO36_6154 [Myxococcales bacterium]|nr:hypothetical protein [Myxococcales bacterium]
MTGPHERVEPSAASIDDAIRTINADTVRTPKLELSVEAAARGSSADLPQAPPPALAVKI